MMNMKPNIPYNEMLIYKIHVRGYTMLYDSNFAHGGAVKCLAHRGTIIALHDMIPYWKELGVTSIECMPLYDFRDFPTNFWGYTDGDYFKVKADYCAGYSPEQELRDFVNALHRAGLECLLDFYFPKECAPELVLKVLQFWSKEYAIDGFVLLGEGVNFEVLAKEESLAEVKLLGLHEYNPQFQHAMRRFLRGDWGMIPAFVHFQKEKSIHYVANHDGFTLADMLTYEHRQNYANGEDNFDGSHENFCWNCGVEGTTTQVEILKLREQQMRNAMMLLLLSQGTALIYGGDEFGNTQKGNNNAYCQDNEIGWTDWSRAEEYADFRKFVQDLIAFRKRHPILSLPRRVTGADPQGLGYPEISYHSDKAWYADMSVRSRAIGVLYCGLYAKREDGTSDDFIYILYNMNEQAKDFALPRLPKGKKWYLAADSGRESKDAVAELGQEESLEQLGLDLRTEKAATGRYLCVNARTIRILIGRHDKRMN